MKKLIIFIILIFLSKLGFSQCNCATIKRDDGTNIVQCNSLPVASDKSTEIGIAIASNGEANFLTVTVRFTGKAQNITGDLTLRLSDDNLLTLSLINSGLAYIGNSEVAQGVFMLNSRHKSKISNASIKTISLKLSDGLIRTYEGRRNTSILMRQVKCL
tara:strand:+ start:1434 stop:1910 length:477 start_codon:yes stop_codon:yes gene_type:complete